VGHRGHRSLGGTQGAQEVRWDTGGHRRLGGTQGAQEVRWVTGGTGG